MTKIIAKMVIFFSNLIFENEREFISKLYLWVIAFTFALQREYFEIENSHNEMKKIQNFIFYNFDGHIFGKKWIIFELIELIECDLFDLSLWFEFISTFGQF